MQLQNHTFIISGGGSGLGAATARLFAANGANVVLADINEAQGNLTASAIGDQARFLKTDVTDDTSVQNAVNAAVKAFGTLHGAVNCAGVGTAER
ncbi:MAG: SDR family NAD(P)-dependent oxidoreductase, partial [Burkholderiales bacterium]